MSTTINPLAGKPAPRVIAGRCSEAARRLYRPAARSGRADATRRSSARPGIAAARSSAASTNGTCWPSARRSATTARPKASTARCTSASTRMRCRGRRCDSALEVLAANGVETMIATDDEYTPTPAISHAILAYNRGRTAGLADGIVITPSHNPPDNGGFKYNPPNGGPADTDITGWIQDRANALLEGGLKDVRRMPCAQARRARDHAPQRLPRRLRGRPRQRDRLRRDPRRRYPHGRRSARWRRRALLGADRGALPASTSPWSATRSIRTSAS